MNLVMYMCVIVLLICAPSQILSSVWRSPGNQCNSALEFTCANGECMLLSAICDGERHCSDGSDESGCYGLPTLGNELNRTKRQATTCRKNQFRCRDGTCIGIDGKCDGIVDCPDRSDETHALCRKSTCQSNWFRCTYGACVDGTAPCNNITECADNSDELLPRCRNENDEVKGNFKCLDGQMIPAANHCDGVADCKDGSDETVRSCAGKTCYSYLFQCAYGACVDQGADCNGVTECADGSDEADELCNKSGGTTGTGTGPSPGTGTRPPPTNPQQTAPSGKCQLPAYPANGRYQVYNAPNASPYQISDFWIIDITCDPGYGILHGENRRFCSSGVWSPTEKMPDCVPFCKLNTHPSVQYRCRSNESGSLDTRSCSKYEPPGTIAIPECAAPNYFSYGELSSILCNNEGMWSDNPTCLLGLPKNGTNVTIIVKDKVEIHISNFQYGGPGTTENDVDYEIDETDWRSGGNANKNSNNWSIKLSGSKEPSRPRQPSSTTRPVWPTTRKPGTPNRNKDRPNNQTNRNSNTRVNFSINNSSVVINTNNTRINFRD